MLADTKASSIINIFLYSKITFLRKLKIPVLVLNDNYFRNMIACFSKLSIYNKPCLQLIHHLFVFIIGEFVK